MLKEQEENETGLGQERDSSNVITTKALTDPAESS
jgi:hypothetical protein